jgi:hypothetical protein
MKKKELGEYDKLVYKKLGTTEPWTPEQHNWYRIQKLLYVRLNATSNDAASVCNVLGFISICVILWFIMNAVLQIK